MKFSTWLIGITMVFVVTYNIVTSVPGQCQQGQKADAYTGMCDQKVQQMQVKFFDDSKDIIQWRKDIPKTKGYTIENIVIYKESPEFLEKTKP